nr:helicase, C-terminal [Tanacetum cinerariifolium]
MDMINLSSSDSDDSDWDLDLIKAINDSVVDDSATSAPPSTRVLPSSFASSSGTTSNAGEQLFTWDNFCFRGCLGFAKL